jgi:hypothetical protein
MTLPLVLIHGYSDQGASFQAWRDKLTKSEPAWAIETIGTCSYQSLTDEVTIKDLADGLDRALQVRFGSTRPGCLLFANGSLAIVGASPK